MKTQSKFSIILVVTLLLVGCSDSFLNVDSRGKIEEKDRNTTYAPKQFVTGVYGSFTTWDYAFAWLGVTEIISDNADKGSVSSDTGVDKGRLDNFQFTSASISVAAMWNRWYKTIGRASYAIDYTRSFGLDDEAYKNRLIGESKFLRALSYFYLVRYFGDVPIQSKDPAVRAPKDSVYAHIISDLKSAEESLPLKSEYAPEDLGRATKGAAQALLSKVYLQRKNWSEALNYANKVINSGEYDLEPNYEDIWKESHENGIESIFEIQARGKAPAHGVQQYSQTQGVRGPGGWGWGFNVPSQNLIDTYNAEGDSIRKNATIIFPGETMWDGRQISSNIVNRGYNQKAYSSADLGAGDTDKNIRVLRYAEVLLIKAEAANELGNTQASLDALNEVRDRVNLPHVTTTDQTALRHAIWKERRLELAFEHDRWFDLLRTGQAAEAIKNSGNAEAAANFDEHYTLFPIPIEQLRKTPDMRQNPGY
ncbi:MAG TPA: RagB/SusD family nutrient uptake outer membrane protein [Balneolaceae bacterium]|nr:RagB/SusD family nutrient uptake outer membrane protein [Balneolaceae bacterium]